jgi:hypothetical protein
MPTFPTYNSDQNIQVQPVAPERHLVEKQFQGINTIEDTLGAISEKWMKAEQAIEYNKAMIGAQDAILKVEQSAVNDPNPDNVESHLKALQDIQDKSTKGMMNPMMSDLVRERLEHSTLLAGIKIDNIFKKKQMFANDQRLDQYASIAAQNKSNAITEASGQQVENDFMGTVQSNVSRGLITPARGEQLVKSYKLGIVKNDSMNDKSTDPGDSQVLKNLNSGKYDLDVKERNQAENMVRARIKQNKEVEINQVMKYRTDIIKGISNGNDTWKNPDTLNKVMKTDPKLAEAMQAVLSADAKGTPYAPEKAQNQNFADMVDKIFSTKTKEDMSDKFIDALKSNANRNMSTDRLAILISAAEGKTATIPTTKGSNDAKPSQQQNMVESNIDGIKDYFKGAEEKMSKVGQVVGDFFKNLTSGSSPQKAQADAIHSFNVKEYPWISSLPKEGALKIDKNGNKVRIYPDGHYEDVK